MTLLIIAWRNIWRNKRRTILSISMITFAFFICTVMRSMQHGTYDHQINQSVGKFSGYIQVHDSGYWDNKSINNLVVFDDNLIQKIKAAEGVNKVIPRLETGILAASEERSRFALIFGVDPEIEKSFSELDKKIVSGRYLSNTDNGVIIGIGLAKRLKMKLNDTLVLYGMGYHAQTAVNLYPIIGLVDMNSYKLNNSCIFQALGENQELLSAPGMVSSIMIGLEDRSLMKAAKKKLQTSLDASSYEIMDWKEMLPELEQMIESDKAGGVIVITILYTIIAFGLFGTVMMMTMEREKEFGILVAIGMQKTRLFSTVTLETFLLGLLGLLVSIVLVYPTILYLHHHPIPLVGETAESIKKMGWQPILPFSKNPMIIINQSLIVFGMISLCLTYPLYSIVQLKIVNAIRSRNPKSSSTRSE